MDATEPISDLVGDLSREEKLSLVHGTYTADSPQGTTGYLPGLPAHGISELRLVDGPLGVRSGEATAFPASIALGATFDPDLARAFGRAVGAETRAKGIDVLLGPGCNLLRVPQCGRSFEYYSEDPHLAGELTAATVRGIQSNDVVATPKHYVANNQEHGRAEVSAVVSERALRELYLPAFEAAVREGDAGAVMSAYNRVNGTYASEHESLLDTVLKGEFDFDGPVMSDWWGVEDGLAAARGGLDLEMPGVGLVDLLSMTFGREVIHRVVETWPAPVSGPEELLRWLVTRDDPHGGMPVPQDSRFALALPAALDTGDLPEDRLDEMVARVLTLHDRVGAIADSPESTEVDSAKHRDLAASLATSATVLLRNDGVLPLDDGQSVALFGPGVDRAKLGGGGSSRVRPERTVDPLGELRERADSVTVGSHHPPIEEAEMFDFGLPEFWPRGADSLDVDAVRASAQRADVAVVLAEDTATEGDDRDSLVLPGQQNRLIAAVAEAAEETVVVLQTAGPVEMPWLGAVDAVVEAWYPGQEAGRAIARVLYGESDPGGRLPVTFAPAGAYPATARANYPGVETPAGYPEARYDEGVLVGYRHFDEHDVEPTFPFGHGHSYSSFAYEGLDVSAGDSPRDAETATVSVTVTNTGDRAGREVVQVYCRAPDASVLRPPRELVGIRALDLDAGESEQVTLSLADRAFSYYDEDAGEWTICSGEFVVEVGRSSRDVRMSARISGPAANSLS